MEDGFQKAQTDNLPQISEYMILKFFSANKDLFSSVEIKGIKAQRSTRNSYSDNAVGYVQVKRDGPLCTVKAKMTPEHKIKSKAYDVALICDESNELILSLECEGCAASEGGCKHIIAFIFWLHRKCSVPSPTEVECYWRKSKLAHVGTNQKFIPVRSLGKRKAKDLPPKDSNVLEECINLIKKSEVNDLRLCSYYCAQPDLKAISINNLVVKFISERRGNTAEDFLNFTSNEMSSDLCEKAALDSVNQNKSSVWYELRYGRITASRIYEASRCSTLNGSLVDAILGAKFKPTEAIKRGVRLEPAVRDILQQKLLVKIHKSGLILNSSYGVFGASPDGVAQDFLVEIKCPMSEKTMSKYLINNLPAPKYYAQMQVQMFFSNKQRGLFCLAHPDFETSHETTEVWVDYDDTYCKNLLEKALLFWKSAVFPAIFKC